MPATFCVVPAPPPDEAGVFGLLSNFSPMPTSDHDLTTLRRLAEEQAEIAALPVHKETINNWRRLNGLERVKPMVWVNEICWHEMNYEDELTLRCEDEFCRRLETQFRHTLYQWRHLPGDMIVEPVIYCPLVIHDTGFGIQEDVDVVRTDDDSSIVSRDFRPQIDSLEDVAKIQFPEVRLDEEASDRDFSRMSEIFEGILPVVQLGLTGAWFAPWDELIRWWDVQKAMLDLVLRPELVHAAMERLVSAYIHRLDQWEALGLLSSNNGNWRIGSGGLGHTDELPPADYCSPTPPSAKQLWGCATAQIFSDVSPAMHEEFALQYERRWLRRWGLTYYGCCEPLHNKMDILRSIPNLRKVSMSPWADPEKGAEELGNKYVFSHKPNPAILADPVWNPDLARRRYREILEKTQGCCVEIILKDISTVRYEPQRLWSWTQIASEEAERFA